MVGDERRPRSIVRARSRRLLAEGGFGDAPRMLGVCVGPVERLGTSPVTGRSPWPGISTLVSPNASRRADRFESGCIVFRRSDLRNLVR
jgi:hypothetical protein